MYDRSDEVVISVAGIDESEVELAKNILWGLIFGCGYKENSPEVEKIWSYYNKVGPFPYAERLSRRPKMPQKICNYRKPKLQWYGRQMSTNFVWNPDYTGSYTGWGSNGSSVFAKGLDQRYGKSMEIANTLARKGLKSENVLYIDTLEGKALDSKSITWEPLGEIYIASAKPLRINEKVKDA
jgi:hypothetical protein